MPGPNSVFTPATTPRAAVVNPRVAMQITTLASGDHAAIARELALRPIAVQDFTSTFSEVRKQGVAKAATFSVAFAQSLQSNDQIGQFFEDVALVPQPDRVAILDAHKTAGLGEGVVHGIGLLPAAHGRAVMKDFLFHSGQPDPQAMAAVANWLSLAGKSIRVHGIAIPSPVAPHDGFFDDVWDAITDVAGGIADAVSSVVDAVVNAVGNLAQVLGQIVSWAADQVKDLVNALIAAGRSLFQIVSDALSASLDALKKMLQGIIDIGKSLADIFVAIANFTVQQIKSVVNALIAIGKSVATIFAGSCQAVLAPCKNSSRRWSRSAGASPRSSARRFSSARNCSPIPCGP